MATAIAAMIIAAAAIADIVGAKARTAAGRGTAAGEASPKERAPGCPSLACNANRMGAGIRVGQAADPVVWRSRPFVRPIPTRPGVLALHGVRTPC